MEAISSDRSRGLGTLLVVGPNLVPLLGVLMFGWLLGQLVLVYWLELATLGVLQFVGILLVGGSARAALRFRLAGVAVLCVWFGTVLALLGVFAFRFAVGDVQCDLSGIGGGVRILKSASQISAIPVLLGAAPFFASHAYRLFTRWVGGRGDVNALMGFMDASFLRQTAVPAGVIVATSMLGSAVWCLVNNAQLPVIALVAAKIAIELKLRSGAAGRQRDVVQPVSSSVLPN